MNLLGIVGPWCLNKVLIFECLVLLVSFFLLAKVNVFKNHIKIKLEILKITKINPNQTIKDWFSLFQIQYYIQTKSHIILCLIRIIF